MREKQKEILFEKFEILDCLKKDTSAAVYLANHMFLGKKIILKSLNTKTQFDSSLGERFKREAKILAQLDHPNIIKVLDFGMYQEYFYISFEYFESDNLRTVLSKQVIDDEQKKHLLIQLFQGLSYAHRSEIIHRDIKPENILVNASLQLKLGDFGLALSLNDMMVTNQYSIVGTPSYMSPEQIQGESLTIQSDLFSAGIVVFEMFVGKNPFLGNDVNSTINNIIRCDETKIFSEKNSFSENIEYALHSLLKKHPKERIASAEKVLEMLNVQLEEKNIPNVLFPEKKQKPYNRLIVGSSVAFAVIAVVSFYILKTKESVEPTSEQNSVSIVKIDSQKEKENSVTSQSKETTHTEPKPKPLSIIATKHDTNSGKNIFSSKVSLPLTKTEQQWGELFVECFPWANVFIDSQKIETTPLSKNIILPEGEHQLMLTHPDYPVFKNKVSIVRNETTSIKIHLDTLFGFLECNVFPWGEVYVDGKFFGQTPFQRPLKLFPGEHFLSLRNPKYRPLSQKIVVTHNDTIRFNHRFEIQ